MKINQIKKNSGAKKFASILGKSTIKKNSDEHKMIQKITTFLLQNKFGVIHGGYKGGAMSAVSDTANAYIKRYGLSKDLNIGVPQKQHDGLWPRVNEASFCDPCPDIYSRLKSVCSGDIAIVCPLGGDGTELEETIVFHENIVNEGLNKYTKANIPIKPLIFLMTKNGTNWKRLIQAKINILDTSHKSINDFAWLHFASSVNEFEKIIKKYL